MNDLAPLAGYLYIRGLIPEDFVYTDAMATAQKVNDCLNYLVAAVDRFTDENTEEEIQYEVYEAGKIAFADDLRFWFKVLYQIVVKDDNGPRFGQFFRVLGVDRVLDIIYRVRTQGY